MPRIEASYYEVHHKLWNFDKGGSNPCQIYFNDDTSNTLTVTLSSRWEFIDIKIEYQKIGDIIYNKITCTPGSGTITINYSISTINFKFNTATYFPVIALHWTYYKITYSTNPDDNPNFTLRGKDICSYSNRCVKGYACSRGVCIKCHPSFFDCINGALSTDCLSHYSSISSEKIPNRGSCTLGYVDLSQFEDFDIIGIIPPFRNGRLTTSFWFYLAEFPKETPSPQPQKHISYDPDYTFFFNFSPDNLIIEFKGTSTTANKKDTWYYVKGGCSILHEDCFLFVKYFDGSGFQYPIQKVNLKGMKEEVDSFLFHIMKPLII